jgi:hypothetical protein
MAEEINGDQPLKIGILIPGNVRSAPIATFQKLSQLGVFKVEKKQEQVFPMPALESSSDDDYDVVRNEEEEYKNYKELDEDLLDGK